MKTCECGQELQLQPVPGSVSFPRRLVCEIHGYNFKYPKTTIPDDLDFDKPNDYLTELCSPADLIFASPEEDPDSRY